MDQAAPPFAVNSSFNGVGLFRVGALRGSDAAQCRYRGSRNSLVCEHVPFHHCLHKLGLRLGVLPSLVAECGVGPALNTPRPEWNKVVDMLRDGTVSIHNMSAANAAAGST